MVSGNKYPTHFIGKTFEESAELFNQNRITDNPVILLGIRRGVEVILNPKKDNKKKATFERIEEGDALIVMAYHSPNLTHFIKSRPFT